MFFTWYMVAIDFFAVFNFFFLNRYCSNLMKNLTVRGFIENRTPIRGKEPTSSRYKVYELIMSLVFFQCRINRGEEGISLKTISIPQDFSSLVV